MSALSLLSAHAFESALLGSNFEPKKVCAPLTSLFAVQDIVSEAQENEEDPTAGLLRGAECNVCMNRPVQVSNCTWVVILGVSTWHAAQQAGAMLCAMFVLHSATSLVFSYRLQSIDA